MDSMEKRGDSKHAVDYARRAVAADPLREEAHYELIRLLAAAGRTDAALRQYREMERLFSVELGGEPSREIQALARGISRGDGLRSVQVSSPAARVRGTPPV